MLTSILAAGTAGAFALALFALGRSEQLASQELEGAAPEAHVFRVDTMPRGFTLLIPTLTLVFVFIAFGMSMDSPTAPSDASALLLMLALMCGGYSLVRIFKVERVAISADGSIEFQALARSVHYSLRDLRWVASIAGSGSGECETLQLDFDGKPISMRVSRESDADALVRRLLELRPNIEVHGSSIRGSGRRWFRVGDPSQRGRSFK